MPPERYALFIRETGYSVCALKMAESSAHPAYLLTELPENSGQSIRHKLQENYNKKREFYNNCIKATNYEA